MGRTEYICLLSAASVDNASKFIRVDDKPPRTSEILPEELANKLSPNSSRLAHLYGLPETHKA